MLGLVLLKFPLVNIVLQNKLESKVIQLRYKLRLAKLFAMFLIFYSQGYHRGFQYG